MRQTGSFDKEMYLTKDNFNTKATLIKRNGRKILGLYPIEKLARKMTQAKHVLQRPPGLTIDAATYDQHLAVKDDWTIVFEIDDGRLYWISVPEFNQHKLWISRGRGPQWVIQFKYLHRDGEDGTFTHSSCIRNSMTPDKPKAPQLSLWGEA